MSEHIDRAVQIADNVIRDVDARRLHNQEAQILRGMCKDLARAIKDLAVVAGWRSEQIKQYFDAWDAGELPAHKALEGINFALAATPPDPT